MYEIEKFYSVFYKNDCLIFLIILLDFFFENFEIFRFIIEDVYICEGKFIVDECFKSFQLFENNKSLGEDGLIVEFYKIFWNIVGNLMVESLNYFYDYGELFSL